MNVSSAQPRLSTPIDTTFSSGPAESLTSEPPPATPAEQPIPLERVAKFQSPLVQAYAPHQLGSTGAPSYPRELNERLGEDYKQACGAGLHVVAALAHLSPAAHVGLAIAGHSATDLVCTDAAPVQVADR